MTGLANLAARLRASGSVFAEDEAELLIAESRTPEELESMIEQRVVGLPLEVKPGVFVPRRRTEVVVREAVALARPGAVVLDLCCGTGAVGVAIHAAVGGVELHASDIEPAAVRCARRNVEPLDGALHEGDLFDPLPASLRGRVDLLVVNAPYVPTDAIALMPPEAREHEPHITLDGGADGVDIQRRVAGGAAEWLAPGGCVLIETSREQSPRTVAAFHAAGLTAEVRRAEDVDGTVVIGGRTG
jgi:release factor glutamine methyltransferase